MLRFNNNFLEFQVNQKRKQQEKIKLRRLISKESLNESVILLLIRTA